MKVSRAIVIRRPPKATVLWRETLERTAGVTRALLNFWLCLGVRALSVCGIRPEHLSLPSGLTPNIGSVVIEKDKVDKMRGRRVPVPRARSVPHGWWSLRAACPIRAMAQLLPTGPALMGAMLRSLGVPLHSARRAAALALRALLHEKKGDFDLLAFSHKIGWAEPGSSFSAYTKSTRLRGCPTCPDFCWPWGPSESQTGRG